MTPPIAFREWIIELMQCPSNNDSSFYESKLFHTQLSSVLLLAWLPLDSLRQLLILLNVVAPLTVILCTGNSSRISNRTKTTVREQCWWITAIDNSISGNEKCFFFGRKKRKWNKKRTEMNEFAMCFCVLSTPLLTSGKRLTKQALWLKMNDSVWGIEVNANRNRRSLLPSVPVIRWSHHRFITLADNRFRLKSLANSNSVWMGFQPPAD